MYLPDLEGILSRKLMVRVFRLISQRSIGVLLVLVMAILPAIGYAARDACVLECCPELVASDPDTCCDEDQPTPIPAGDREPDSQDHRCCPQCVSPACRAIDLPNDQLEITYYDTLVSPSLEPGVAAPSAFTADAIFHPPRG
jgi:hypothetical protein